MKTVITLYYSKVNVKGITHRESNIVMASCKSKPPNRMDCERVVSWNDTMEEDLKVFITRLKDVVYQDSSIDIEIIDERDFNLPVYII